MSEPVSSIQEQALARLAALVEEASKHGLREPHSASLATATREGRPSVRMVHIESIGGDGLLFFANLQSGKGHQLIENPRAAACFFWSALQQQVIVEGSVDLLSNDESDLHWEKRSRESRLASWAAEQTQVLDEKARLQEKLSEFRQQFDFSSVARPEHWRAFLLRPERIDFWQTGWRRLRARTRYIVQDNGKWIEEIWNP